MCGMISNSRVGGPGAELLESCRLKSCWCIAVPADVETIHEGLENRESERRHPTNDKTREIVSLQTILQSKRQKAK